jgi:hypothetical protein
MLIFTVRNIPLSINSFRVNTNKIRSSSFLCTTIITFDLIIYLSMTSIDDDHDRYYYVDFFFFGSSSFLSKIVRAMFFSRFFSIIMLVDPFNRTCRHVMNIVPSVFEHIYSFLFFFSIAHKISFSIFE